VPFKDEPEPVAEPAAGVRLWLGCNQNPKPGWVNVDIEPFQGVDVVADLEKPWPWPDNHADEIACADLPEHLRMWYEEPDAYDLEQALLFADEHNFVESIRRVIRAVKAPQRRYGIIHFMNEAWRVLKPGGRLDALIPSTDGRGWSQDPTHVSHWNENSFLYFCDPLYMKLYPHLIKCKFKPLRIATGLRNQLEINWVRATLEAVKE